MRHRKYATPLIFIPAFTFCVLTNLQLRDQLPDWFSDPYKKRTNDLNEFVLIFTFCANYTSWLLTVSFLAPLYLISYWF